MSAKRELVAVLREISASLDRIELVLIEQGRDLRHRVEILEIEAPRTERRLLNVEGKVAAQ